jgi:hypothetical protein
MKDPGMKNEKHLQSNKEEILRFISAFCMLIAGYLTLYVNLDFIIEHIVFSRSAYINNYVLPISLIMILVLIGWLIASYHNTTYMANYCGTKYSGFAKTDNGYITTMWLAIFGLALVPVKSVWFPDEGRDKYTEQEPSPMDQFYMDQIFPTIIKSVITITLFEIFFFALFYLLGRYFHVHN